MNVHKENSEHRFFHSSKTMCGKKCSNQMANLHNNATKEDEDAPEKVTGVWQFVTCEECLEFKGFKK